MFMFMFKLLYYYDLNEKLLSYKTKSRFNIIKFECSLLNSVDITAHGYLSTILQVVILILQGCYILICIKNIILFTSLFFNFFLLLFYVYNVMMVLRWLLIDWLLLLKQEANQSKSCYWKMLFDPLEVLKATLTLIEMIFCWKIILILCKFDTNIKPLLGSNTLTI